MGSLFFLKKSQFPVARHLNYYQSFTIKKLPNLHAFDTRACISEAGSLEGFAESYVCLWCR